MAFTQAWDEAVPADTQLANLLGDNVRDDKRDTRERMRAFAIGTLAQRETPEAVFGQAGQGVGYFVTDDGTIFYWSGSAWVDVTVIFRPKDFSVFTPVTITNPGADTDGLSITIPANTLAATKSYIEVVAAIRGGGAVGASQKLMIGQAGPGFTNICIIPPFSTSDYYLLKADIQFGAATQISMGHGHVAAQGGGAGAVHMTFAGSLALSTAADITIKTVCLASAAVQVVHEFLRVKTSRLI